jgi:hypothetical protein
METENMAKKAAAKAPAAPKPTKLVPAAKQRKKSELFQILAEHSGISRKQVAGVFEALGKVMSVDLAKPTNGKPRLFVVPGMMRIKSEFKAAVPARKGMDPFTKTEKMFKAKPASTRLKIRPLKALKAMV